MAQQKQLTPVHTLGFQMLQKMWKWFQLSCQYVRWPCYPIDSLVKLGDVVQWLSRLRCFPSQDQYFDVFKRNIENNAEIEQVFVEALQYPVINVRGHKSCYSWKGIEICSRESFFAPEYWTSFRIIEESLRKEFIGVFYVELHKLFQEADLALLSWKLKTPRGCADYLVAVKNQGDSVQAQGRNMSELLACFDLLYRFLLWCN